MPLPARKSNKRLDLCLDLADCEKHIFTTGHVVWSNASGRAGVHFSELSPQSSLGRLREWLFVNVMAGVANGEADLDSPRIATPDNVFAPRITPILSRP